MSHDDSLNQMSEDLRLMLAYWTEQRDRRGGNLPHRNNMQALEMAQRCPAVMPHIWMLDVERDPWRFRFRMISRSIRASGASAGIVQVGRYLSDLEGARDWRPLYLSMVRVCESREPDYRSGTPHISPNPDVTRLERLSLPLAHDGHNVDVILSATIYRRDDGSIVD